MPSRLLCAALMLVSTTWVTAPVLGQTLDEVIPPPPTTNTEPVQEAVPVEAVPEPEVEVVPAPPVEAHRMPSRIAPTSQTPSQTLQTEWNLSAPPTGGQFGNPNAPPPVAMAPARRRGDSLQDRAQAGEIIDLMIMTGGYGMLLANGIVNWSGADRTSGSDLVNIRFGATFIGAALSLTGLLAIEAPRGTPTLMTIGLRYGTIAGGFVAGALRADDDGTVGALAVGGLLGFGIGAGLGYALRPHIARSRFVEAGAFWGAGLGFLMGGAVRGDDRTTWGLGLGGMTLGMLTNALVASLTPASAGRGWLLNAAFAAPAGLAALAVIVASNGRTDAGTVFGVSAAIGLLGLGIVFGISDGIQDSGWVEDSEVISSLQLGISPSLDGQGATVSLSGQF